MHLDFYFESVRTLGPICLFLFHDNEVDILVSGEDDVQVKEATTLVRKARSPLLE